MNPIVRNIAALVGGVVVGSLVNILIVNLGPYIIPLPEGADVSSMEALKESMSLFSPINFIPPFLAHALGTLVGAFVAARFSASRHVTLALVVGVVSLLGGISAVVTLGGPLWFILLDLGVAYLPMAYLGATLAARHRASSRAATVR